MRRQWQEDRQADLLPVEYFHVIFTLPETLRASTAAPKFLGAEIGFIAILHAWGQNLQHHPYLHCVVPGGGISDDGECWVTCRPGFLLPVRVVTRLFRWLFFEQLQAAFDAGQLHFFNALEALQSPTAFARYLAPVRKVDWVVYAKPPFGRSQQVLEYLGRCIEWLLPIIV